MSYVKKKFIIVLSNVHIGEKNYAQKNVLENMKH